MKEYDCDILVAGAGPAGSCAARKAALGGAKVLLLERKPVIGEPVRCAEFIPKQLLGELGCQKNFIVQPVNSMRTILPDGEVSEIRSPGCMIDRSRFDQELAFGAEEAGAETWLETRVHSFINNIVTVFKNNDPIAVRPKIIIGADGPRSRVGKWAGLCNKNLIPAVQATVSLKKTMDYTEVYFNRDFYGGYGWIFPKGNKANIGIGMKPLSGYPGILENLHRFIREQKDAEKITGSPESYTAGWIPAELPEKAVYKNIMLAGDAAGQTHPVTGAGVSQAVISGRMAGRWAARAVKENNLSLINGYDSEWQDLFGESQKRAYERRVLMENNWNDLNNIIKKCWVAFREYYKA